ncbi:MAG: hypothetical protein JMN26_05515, partial [gamma proteobacterium endosymbiont of Lamellibrachia anaximandri]|nr:hypothetical protein [gamma proteobacterium endosymbiont of Lamellibrachia anaximandri]
MKSFRIPAFLQALLIIAAAYLVFKFGFPPLLPQTLMIQYMIITIIGVLLYFSFDDERWAEFQAPVLATLRNDNLSVVRWFFLRCQPWRAKRRLVVPGSREAALLTRRALRQRGSKVGIRARRPV